MENLSALNKVNITQNIAPLNSDKFYHIEGSGDGKKVLDSEKDGNPFVRKIGIYHPLYWFAEYSARFENNALKDGSYANLYASLGNVTTLGNKLKSVLKSIGSVSLDQLNEIREKKELSSLIYAEKKPLSIAEKTHLNARIYQLFELVAIHSGKYDNQREIGNITQIDIDNMVNDVIKNIKKYGENGKVQINTNQRS